MTRKEEIEKLSEELFATYLDTDCSFLEIVKRVIKWANEHPKNPWRDVKKEQPKDGEWCLFKFTTPSWSHGLYEARQMPNMAMNDYIKSGEIIGWMPIPEPPKGDEK